ncbi:MAG: pyrimidine/purine nucleoside phosphorylase [Pontiellaceae bacterium]|nr:pyrimidine/purine nucleoside phosphorylase [Pontiellaceae bacterium]MBN2783280.1 pyrimidine/purine nucleoside phosphorylase [Pontiellaceae bacterium]
MSEFNDVTVVREANVYFDGKVTSRTVRFADGTRKTLGFMQPGEYSFDTAAAEVMEMLGGEMDVLLPGSTHWKTVTAGESFDVPANSRFDLVVKTFADYCCSYIEA